MKLVGRRSIPLVVVHGAAALTVACAWESVRPSDATRVDTTRADATRAGGAADDVRWVSTEERQSQSVGAGAPDERARTVSEPPAAAGRATPLPVPLQDERAWLQEWLDLTTLTSRKATTGC